MTLLKRMMLLVIVLAGVIGFLLSYFQQAVVEQKPGDDNALQTAIEQCGDITERAAAHLVAVVEFQKLEIIGRKARVFKMCMQDHHYIENKAWLNYSQPIAEKTAKENNISINEALENLRRANMAMPNGEYERPVYWVKVSPSKAG